MITEYKHIKFTEVDPPSTKRKRKTKIWECHNHGGDYLGVIEWYGRWRQYCFVLKAQEFEFEYSDVIFARSCLDDISSFIDQVMEMRIK